MLQIAAGWIEQEKKELVAAKEAHMSESCPTPDLSGDMAALTVSTHCTSTMNTIVRLVIPLCEY